MSIRGVEDFYNTLKTQPEKIKTPDDILKGVELCRNLYDDPAEKKKLLKTPDDRKIFLSTLNLLQSIAETKMRERRTLRGYAYSKEKRAKLQGCISDIINLKTDVSVDNEAKQSDKLKKNKQRWGELHQNTKRSVNRRFQELENEIHSGDSMLGKAVLQLDKAVHNLNYTNYLEAVMKSSTSPELSREYNNLQSEAFGNILKLNESKHYIGSLTLYYSQVKSAVKNFENEFKHLTEKYNFQSLNIKIDDAIIDAESLLREIEQQDPKTMDMNLMETKIKAVLDQFNDIEKMKNEVQEIISKNIVPEATAGTKHAPIIEIGYAREPRKELDKMGDKM